MRVFKRLSFGIIGVMLALMISAAPVFAAEADDKTTEAVTTEASSKESEEETTEAEKTTESLLIKSQVENEKSFY